MPDAWDTSVASRIHGDGRHARRLRAHLSQGTTVALPAPAVQEVTRGLELQATNDARFARRLLAFTEFVAQPMVQVLAFDALAALLAGRLLARHPHPPSRRQQPHGTRARQRAAWALDVQIAACAFAGGYGILTENVADFAVLRDAITTLVPGVPPLLVSDAREPAESAAAP
jgi:predicted nucleic acid-binding protein